MAMATREDEQAVSRVMEGPYVPRKYETCGCGCDGRESM